MERFDAGIIPRIRFFRITALHICSNTFVFIGIEQLPFKGDTVIGNDVWIGQNVTIMPGVIIGDGAIIAANSTVVKSVEPYSIYGGNPAKFIKKRFSDEKIEFLLKLEWWNWSGEEIFDNLEILTSEAGLEELMNKYSKRDAIN